MFKNTETLTRGDILNYEAGRLDLGTLGDASLVGCAVETLNGEMGRSQIQVVTDADAVYGVADQDARSEGDHLDLTGATGAQGVVTSSGSQFTVVLDSPAEAKTLVRIADGRHHQVGETEGVHRLVGGDLNAAIARAVVRFHREETGRGPNKARAFYRDDVIVVVLEDLMTQVERRLVARGEEDVVRQMRATVQNGMRAELVAIVEELTGTRVRAFMSSNNLDPDMAIQAFVLENAIRPEPDTGGGAS